MVKYRVILSDAKSRVTFSDASRMLQYIHTLNEKGISYTLQFDRDEDESEAISPAPLRHADELRGDHAGE